MSNYKHSVVTVCVGGQLRRNDNGQGDRVSV